VRKSQLERNADVTLVDKIIELDQVARAGKSSLQSHNFFSAKYALDNLNKDKNAISKVVAQKKKDSKGQDKCEEEIAQSKAIDDKIAEQKKITAEAVLEQEKALNKIGNILHPNATVSKTEDDNKVMRTFL
jgi:seryl-tRNA synthetase